MDSLATLQNSNIIPLKVKAHEVHASLQLFNKEDLQAVMKAGRWSNGGTFTSLETGLCPQAESVWKTGPVVAAEEIIEISS